ncbi:MAG TPA: tetratricopeptide repeat protein, partial [Chitinophagales bacterium]|nr:tetratricopeptide repeat protein [Chitinophagales bacterium]
MSSNETILELEVQLQQNNTNSKERVDILHQLIAYYLNIDLNKTKIYIDEAEKISTEINYEEGIGTSFLQLGIFYYRNSDFENALINYLKADELLSKSMNWKNRIKPKANIAMVYMNTQQYEEALRIYNEIENEIKLIPIDIIHAQMYINIDAAYCFLKDPKNGILYSKKALEISEQLESNYGIAVSKSNLAGHLILLNQPEEALEQLAISEQICETDDYKVIQVGNYLKYAESYTRLHQYDAALQYANKGFFLAKEIQDVEKEILIIKLTIDIYE